MAWSFTAPSALGAAGLKNTYSFRDGATVQPFELAKDELEVGSGGHAQTLKVSSTTAAALQKRAAQLRQATGKPVSLVAYEARKTRSQATRRVITSRVVVQLKADVDVQALANSIQGVWSSISFAPGYYVFEVATSEAALVAADTLRVRPGVISADVELGRLMEKRLYPNDTLFPQEWHLLNIGQTGAGVPRIDVNITNVWETYRGEGITIGIVDDGLQYTHPDLVNANTNLMYDFLDNDPDAYPNVTNDFHGTAVAGVAAGKGTNNLGVAGAAFNAELSGIRLIGGFISDRQIAGALAFSNDVIHIKNNSWGPFDSGDILLGPGPMADAAIQSGVTLGRGGKGVVYVWAGGNGRLQNDNANADGFANHTRVIAVGALDSEGLISYYSEPGACLAVVAPSSGLIDGITTTDLVGDDGYNTTNSFGEVADRDYTQLFGGTSSSAPLTAGVIGLMLQANPNLGYRDVKEILMATARVVDTNSTDWITNSGGFHFNHDYGAGLIDADAAVRRALTWRNLAPLTNLIQRTNVNLLIPDSDPFGVEHRFRFSCTSLRVETVKLTVDIEHFSRGDLAISIISPSGVESRLAELHDDRNADYPLWTFSSVHHWGEESQGIWTVRITDLRSGTAGRVRFLGMTIEGTPGPQRPFIVEAGSAILAETGGVENGSIEPGETVTVKFGLENIGSAPTTNLVATLLEQGGVVFASGPQNYGVLEPCGAGPVSRAFTFTAAGACGGTLTATLHLQDGPNDLGLVTYSFVMGRFSAVYTNTRAITIPRVGNARPFPSSIMVSGFNGKVAKVSVTLSNVNHSFAQDMDILLVGPRGQKVLLLSDVGGGSGVRDATITISDGFGRVAGLLGSGTVRPSNVDVLTDAFPVGKPFGSSLSVFNGTNPNGRWSLYVRDDRAGNSGLIAGGWSLNITGIISECQDTVADLSVTATSAPEPVPLNEQLVYTVRVDNNGPGPAASVIMRSFLPTNMTLLSVAPSQGTYTNSTNGVNLVTITLGSIAAGGSATAEITVSPNAVGLYTNRIQVFTSVRDPDLSNNVFLASASVAGPGGATANPKAITIPASGPASPFPSPITVAGLGNSIQKVSVTLWDLNHPFPVDLDILLVGPDGQSVMLMSDAGGFNPVGGLTVTFDDDAGVSVPADSLTSGTYVPTNIGTSVDNFPAPAPSGPPATSLSSFAGKNPNGQWFLYVLDDSAVDGGMIAGGWSLNIVAP